MNTVPNVESGFTHVMSVIFADLEADVKSLATMVEKEWPTIEDLLTSGQIGQDILKALAMIEPVFSLVEFVFPQTTPIITWAESIIKQLAALKIFNTPCTCVTCSK